MKKRTRPVRALISNIHELSSEDIQASKSIKMLLMIEVPNAISEALKSKKQYASVFEINSSDAYVELHKKDWIKSLEICLDYYASPDKEDYETCLEIKQLISKIAKKKITENV